MTLTIICWITILLAFIAVDQGHVVYATALFLMAWIAFCASLAADKAEAAKAKAH
jgi:hypothetical protein